MKARVIHFNLAIYCVQTNDQEFDPNSFNKLSFFCLQGNHLSCRNSPEVKSVYLPLGDQSNNYSLSVVVTVKNENETATTAVHTQVCYLPAHVSQIKIKD